MEVASSDDDGVVLIWDGFGRGHEAHVIFLVVWQGGASENASLASKARGDFAVNCASEGRSRRRPFAPWLRSRFVFPNANHS